MDRSLVRLTLTAPLLCLFALGCSPGPSASECAALRAARRARLTSPPQLGSAAAFAALGATAVNNTGRTMFLFESGLTADVGVSPGNVITGMCANPPSNCGATGVITPPSTEEIADAVAAQAQTDATTAYNAAVSSSCTSDKSGVDLGSQTLTPGVYCFSSSASLTGNLNLDGQNDPNAVFIFQIAGDLNVAANAFVELINGGSECNILWQVGGSATLNTNSQVIGSVLAKGDVTVNNDVNLIGRAVSQTGAVNINAAFFQVNHCTSGGTIDGGVADAGSPDAGSSGSDAGSGSGSSDAGAGDESDAGSLGACGE